MRNTRSIHRKRRASLALRAAFVVVILLLPDLASACPVCFGNPDSPMTKAASSAVWFLLAVVGVVQVGFIALFVSFWKRARQMRKIREQFTLVDGGLR